MKKTIKFISIFLVLVTALTALPMIRLEDSSVKAASSSTVKAKIRGYLLYNYEWSVLSYVNKERAKRGLSKLKMSQGLNNVANRRAAEISLYYSHQRPNGEKNSFGMYPWKYNVAENIAINQKSPKEVVQAWMKSKVHKKNILNKKFNSSGIGCFKINGVIYWTQFFVDNKTGTQASKQSNKWANYTIDIKKSYINIRQKGSGLRFNAGDRKKRKLTVYQYVTTIKNYEFLTPLYYNYLVFRSSNIRIASVDKYGYVTPKSKGLITVTAYLKGVPSQKASWKVRVI